MSRSPDDPEQRSADYSDGWTVLYELMRQGKSFSGRERNCLYLNTGGPRFADVSAVSGFDFLDDGRGLAVSDWDLDGALDLWVTSRTAPRLRLLRNTGASGNRFVALRLEGRGPNRDAIGARVEVVRSGSARRSVKQLAAGDAFLSQSSKWMHFGLGSAGGIERVLVTWPGGEREEFAGVEPDLHYRLVQGTGAARPFELPPAIRERVARRAPLSAAPQVPAQRTQRAVIRLAAPVPMLGLEYLDAERRPRELVPRAGRPLLVNLWATWCPNCRAELRELERRSSELGAARLDVLALSVDEAPERVKAREVLERLGWSHELGFATEELLEVLAIHEQVLLDRTQELVLPTSLLLDGQGRLTTLYHGPVEVDTLLEDAERSELAPERRRELASPFSGRWLEPPIPARLVTLAGRLRRHGHLEVAAAYLGRIAIRDDLGSAGDEAAARRLADSHELLGRELAARGMHAEAIEAFEGCLRADPDRSVVHVELGNSLRALDRPEDAMRQFAAAIELDPESGDGHYSVGLMHALSGSLGDARRHFELAVRYDPENHLAQFNLGITLARSEELDRAAKHVRTALDLSPDYLQASQTLGRIHHDREQYAQAIAVLRDALERHPRDAQLLFALGRAYVASGDRGQAREIRGELAQVNADLAARLASEIAQMP